MQTLLSESLNNAPVDSQIETELMRAVKYCKLLVRGVAAAHAAGLAEPEPIAINPVI